MLYFAILYSVQKMKNPRIYHAGEAIIMLVGKYENFANVVAENIIKTRCIRIK